MYFNKGFISGSMHLHNHIQQAADKKNGQGDLQPKAVDQMYQNLHQLLDKMMSKQQTVLVGDCYSGVDNDVINYLNAKQYPNVEIGCDNHQPRQFKAKYNVSNHQSGTWQSHWTENEANQSDQKTKADLNLNGVYGHNRKDVILAATCDFGIGAINPRYSTNTNRQRVSVGTLRNMVQLVKMNKPAYLIYYQDHQAKTANLKSISQLDQIIEQYHDPEIKQKYQQTKTKELNRIEQGFNQLNPTPNPKPKTKIINQSKPNQTHKKPLIDPGLEF